ncbi:MAG: tail-specific protease [Gammaproteobacteria bacterium]|nr:MAG: tail-specific protease [Gammaproteobacteria bacterium]
MSNPTNPRIRPILLLPILLWSIAWPLAAQARPQPVALESLQPTEDERRTALVIAQVLEGFHYTRPHIDDQLSRDAFDRFLESLDPNKNFFTREDIDRFSAYRDYFDDALTKGKLAAPFEIFRLFRHKVEQRAAYAIDLLNNYPFDFSRDERYVFDREDEPWARDEKALDDLWRKRVKNDILVARLDDSKPFDKQRLQKRYEGLRDRVRQMKAEDVFQTFVNAVTLSIEPHTSYMSPEVSENFDIGMRLSLQGIGAVLRSEDGYTKILRTVVGGPAARSGKLHPGDHIVGVAQGRDGAMEDVVGWRLQDVVELIRGPKGSIVRLSIIPKGEGIGGRAREVVLVRDTIKLEDKAAKSKILQGPEFGGLKIGVIDLPAFYRDFAGQAAGKRNFRSTTRDVRKLLEALESQGVDGVIIDLRQNGGGSLAEATELTGLFIDRGPVVQIKDAASNVELEKDTDPGEVYRGPLIVLVDRNSASASEIFAGAIKDYGRGLIVGEPTFGKGTVQTLVNLARYLRSDHDLGRLRLTMAQFFRVLGASTQLKGVEPDIEFPTAQGARDYGERALDHALPWAAIQPVVEQPRVEFPISYLRERSNRRIARDPGFQFLIDQEKEFMRIKDHKDASLNEAKRKAEREQREQRLLALRNRLRTWRGLPPLKSLDEEDEDEKLAHADEDPEGIERIMLDETARIMVDWIKTSRPLTAQRD